jgi:Leucine-rich repeat (LRR) protein
MPADDPLDVTRRDADPDLAAARLYRDLAGRAPRPSSATGTRVTTGNAPSSPGDRLPPPLPSVPGPGLDGGRWRFAEHLGGGGGGEVFAVEDLRLQRPLAVKVLPIQASSLPDRAARFLAEARTAAALEHPSILPIYDLGRAEDGRLWFTMRRAIGRTLADAIADLAAGRKVGGLDGLDERVALGVRLCEAIAFAHARGVLHCDLKPGNIMLGDYGEVLVVDWGSAVRDGTAGGGAGTPLYMAPEQARHEAPTPAWDVYGLGATLWHLLLLRPPLIGSDGALDFWQRKRAGEIDPPSASEMAALPGSLLVILQRCVAATPEERIADAATLRDQLRGWLRGREAEVLIGSAERHLAALRERGDHAAFARVEHDLERAAEIAPDPAAAHDTRLRARAAHAAFAIATGDLGLAAGLIDPAAASHAEVRRALQRASLARARRRAWGLVSAGLATVIVVLLAAWTWHEHRARFGLWQPVWQRDFAAGADAKGLTAGPWISATTGTALESTTMPGRTVVAEDGAVELRSDDVYTLPVEVSGSLRVTIGATWTVAVDGLEIMAHCSPRKPTSSWLYPAGVVAQFGGYLGERTILGVQRDLGVLRPVDETMHDFTPVRRYELALTIDRETMTLTVDGQPVLSHFEALRLGNASFRSIHLRCWAERARIDSIVVERLGDPPRSSPLLYGDGLLAAGRPDLAAASYLQVATDHPGSAIEEEGLANAFAAATTSAGRGGPSHEAILARLIAAHPDSVRLPALWEVAAASHLAAGGLDEALAHIARIRQRVPDSPAPRRLIEQLPIITPPATTMALVELLRDQRTPFSLPLSDRDVTSLAPLAGTRVSRLYIGNNPVSDLTPLASTSLRHLEARNSPISDLAPLAGLPLRTLALPGCSVRDLRPLASLRDLHGLDVDRNPIGDLAPLAGRPLKLLIASHTRVSDLAPLAGAPLADLRLDDTAVRNLAPLVGMPLIELHLTGTPVEDLTPLAGIGRLERLMIAYTQVVDLAPLRGLRLLRLNLDSSRVEDLSPLNSDRLVDLGLARTRVRSLAGLDCRNLERLDLSGTAVTDLSPLVGGRLLTLEVTHTTGVDLRPVASTLKSLEAAGATIDLAPLAGSQISHLDLSGSRVVSFRPILELPKLTYLRIAEATAADGSTLDEIAEGLRSLQAPQPQRAAAVAALLARHEWGRLRTLSTPIGGRRYLDLHLHATRAEALALAQRAGATLPTLSQPHTHDQIFDLFSSSRTIWLGSVRDGDGSWSWADGRAIDAQRLPYQVRSNPDTACLMLTNFLRSRPLASCTTAELPTARCGVGLEWSGP